MSNSEKYTIFHIRIRIRIVWRATLQQTELQFQFLWEDSFHSANFQDK